MPASVPTLTVVIPVYNESLCCPNCWRDGFRAIYAIVKYNLG